MKWLDWLKSKFGWSSKPTKPRSVLGGTIDLFDRNPDNDPPKHWWLKTFFIAVLIMALGAAGFYQYNQWLEEKEEQDRNAALAKQQEEARKKKEEPKKVEGKTEKKEEKKIASTSSGGSGAVVKQPPASEALFPPGYTGSGNLVVTPAVPVQPDSQGKAVAQAAPASATNPTPPVPGTVPQTPQVCTQEAGFADLRKKLDACQTRLAEVKPVTSPKAPSTQNIRSSPQKKGVKNEDRLLAWIPRDATSNNRKTCFVNRSVPAAAKPNRCSSLQVFPSIPGEETERWALRALLAQAGKS